MTKNPTYSSWIGLPDLLDYGQSLFQLRDSQRKRTSERTRKSHAAFALVARHARHVKKAVGDIPLARLFVCLDFH